MGPPEAQDRLLGTITDLSAPGSRVATESRPNVQPGEDDKMKERLHRISERWRAHGFDVDMARLRYFGERNEAAQYLTELGWALNELPSETCSPPTPSAPKGPGRRLAYG